MTLKRANQNLVSLRRGFFIYICFQIFFKLKFFKMEKQGKPTKEEKEAAKKARNAEHAANKQQHQQNPPPISQTGQDLINETQKLGSNNSGEIKPGENSNPGQSSNEQQAIEQTNILVGTGGVGTAPGTEQEQPDSTIINNQPEISSAIQAGPLQSENFVSDADKGNAGYSEEEFIAKISETPTERLQTISAFIAEELTRRGQVQSAALMAGPVKKEFTTDEIKQMAERELTAIYGENYVKATNGDREGYFTRFAWNEMSGNKDGWVEAVTTPPEVQALNK